MYLEKVSNFFLLHSFWTFFSVFKGDFHYFQAIPTRNFSRFSRLNEKLSHPWELTRPLIFQFYQKWKIYVLRIKRQLHRILLAQSNYNFGTKRRSFFPKTFLVLWIPPVALENNWKRFSKLNNINLLHSTTQQRVKLHFSIPRNC